MLTALKGDKELASIPVVMLTITDEKNLGFSLGASAAGGDCGVVHLCGVKQRQLGFDCAPALGELATGADGIGVSHAVFQCGRYRDAQHAIDDLRG